MEIPIYQINTFTNQVFSGNPACVCLLKEWLDNSLLQAIAKENNLSETAFFVPEENNYHIRWFTPVREVDLYGHATLAAAFVLFNYLSASTKEITFNSRSGHLKVVAYAWMVYCG
jgi:PhzF family phenazine biosynthesis protein